MSKPTLNQINLISGDLDASIAFYRRLGVEIPDTAVWRTPTGGHHVGVAGQLADQVFHLDIDSTVFAQTWNSGWKGRTDLRGRVIVGFDVPTRTDVDKVYRDMTGAGYRGLQEPHDAIWGARYAVLEDPDGNRCGPDESKVTGQEVAASESVIAPTTATGYSPCHTSIQ